MSRKDWARMRFTRKEAQEAVEDADDATDPEHCEDDDAVEDCGPTYARDLQFVVVVMSDG